MNPKEHTPRQEVAQVFRSEKFLYICILMTIATLTGIIFSISNSTQTYSYFYNPIISELVSAALSNIISIFVIISYIPMIIGMGFLWLMRESARTNTDNLKKALWGIMSYRVYFYLNIFTCISAIIFINILGIVVPVIMLALEVDSTIIIITIIALRVAAFIISVGCIFMGIFLYNIANFLCEVALTIRVNKNMITKNQILVYCNYIFAAVMVIFAPFSGFTGFIFCIAFAAALILLNVCISDHNYKYEAPEATDVKEFYKNLSFNPEYKELADAMSITQSEKNPDTLSKTKIETEKYRVMLNMLLGVSLYEGDLFKDEYEDTDY